MLIQDNYFNMMSTLFLKFEIFLSNNMLHIFIVVIHEINCYIFTYRQGLDDRCLRFVKRIRNTIEHEHFLR